MDRYRVNDVLTALAAEMGVELDDDTLNDLTHHVADALEPDARQRPDEFSNQFAPEPHILKNVYNEATVEVRGEIDADGDFDTLMNQYEVVNLEGDNYIYCVTCEKRVSPGDGHGLAEDWQVQ